MHTPPPQSGLIALQQFVLHLHSKYSNPDLCPSKTTPTYFLRNIVYIRGMVDPIDYGGESRQVVLEKDQEAVIGTFDRIRPTGEKVCHEMMAYRTIIAAPNSPFQYESNLSRVNEDAYGSSGIASGGKTNINSDCTGIGTGTGRDESVSGSGSGSDSAASSSSSSSSTPFERIDTDTGTGTRCHQPIAKPSDSSTSTVYFHRYSESELSADDLCVTESANLKPSDGSWQCRLMNDEFENRTRARIMQDVKNGTLSSVDGKEEVDSRFPPFQFMNRIGPGLGYRSAVDAIDAIHREIERNYAKAKDGTGKQ